MMNGPPTPPATTSTELLDAERSVVDVPATENLAANPMQHDSMLVTEVYQKSRRVFGSAIAQKDYQSLVRAAEEADIIVCYPWYPEFLHICSFSLLDLE